MNFSFSSYDYCIFIHLKKCNQNYEASKTIPKTKKNEPILNLFKSTLKNIFHEFLFPKDAKIVTNDINTNYPGKAIELSIFAYPRLNPISMSFSYKIRHSFKFSNKNNQEQNFLTFL